VRDGEDEAEEDGEPVPLQVVVDDQAYRMLGGGGRGCRLDRAILTGGPAEMKSLIGSTGHFRRAREQSSPALAAASQAMPHHP
jgi:hypothetical protein